MLKRDNWTNDEVIDILEGLMIPIKMDDAKRWSKEEYDSVVNWNQPLLSAISQFSEFKADPNDWVAKALDTETNQIVVISPPLPQQLMTAPIQAEYEYILREKNLHIKVLEDQIKLKDKQLDELVKAYANVLIERDSYKKALETL